MSLSVTDAELPVYNYSISNCYSASGSFVIDNVSVGSFTGCSGSVQSTACVSKGTPFIKLDAFVVSSALKNTYPSKTISFNHTYLSDYTLSYSEVSSDNSSWDKKVKLTVAAASLCSSLNSNDTITIKYIKNNTWYNVYSGAVNGLSGGYVFNSPVDPCASCVSYRIVAPKQNHDYCFSEQNIRGTTYNSSWGWNIPMQCAGVNTFTSSPYYPYFLGPDSPNGLSAGGNSVSYNNHLKGCAASYPASPIYYTPDYVIGTGLSFDGMISAIQSFVSSCNAQDYGVSYIRTIKNHNYNYVLWPEWTVWGVCKKFTLKTPVPSGCYKAARSNSMLGGGTDTNSLTVRRSGQGYRGIGGYEKRVH
ncbi:MAG: hypothetical protein HQL10_13460 [Nitrospirae bacterium]|nr:hypothetical protein [Nitrospirota bacterium]